MKNISKHVTYKEGTYSNTANRLGLANDPTEEQLENMKLVAEKVFEPLREHVSHPIKINSFFRGPQLNKAIGGSHSSQHCKGQAIDIDDSYGNSTNAYMYEWIKKNLDYDQMIWEFGTDENPDWVHVSFVNEGVNRNRCLKAYRKEGSRKTYYKII
jgi:hypothetical protein